MKKFLCALAFTATLSVSAMANANSQTGCGLGTLVITQPNTAILYALQATTNATSGNQTFGITSGTLNCRKAVFVMNERVQEFVASNMDALHKEISIGRGENLDTLVELLEVQDKETFKTNLQENYIAIYNNSSADMATTLDNIHTL